MPANSHAHAYADRQRDYISRYSRKYLHTFEDCAAFVTKNRKLIAGREGMQNRIMKKMINLADDKEQKTPHIIIHEMSAVALMAGINRHDTFILTPGKKMWQGWIKTYHTKLVHRDVLTAVRYLYYKSTAEMKEIIVADVKRYCPDVNVVVDSDPRTDTTIISKCAQYTFLPPGLRDVFDGADKYLRNDASVRMYDMGTIHDTISDDRMPGIIAGPYTLSDVIMMTAKGYLLQTAREGQRGVSIIHRVLEPADMTLDTPLEFATTRDEWWKHKDISGYNLTEVIAMGCISGEMERWITPTIIPRLREETFRSIATDVLNGLPYTDMRFLRGMYFILGLLMWNTVAVDLLHYVGYGPDAFSMFTCISDIMVAGYTDVSIITVAEDISPGSHNVDVPTKKYHTTVPLEDAPPIATFADLVMHRLSTYDDE